MTAWLIGLIVEGPFPPRRAVVFRSILVVCIVLSTAIAIIDTVPDVWLHHEDLVQAIRGRDVKALTRIPGVGKKTAEKICFELSEKLGGLTGLDGLSGIPSGDPWEESLRSALTNLGFKEDVVLPVVAELRAAKPPLAEAIRQALKALQR